MCKKSETKISFFTNKYMEAPTMKFRSDKLHPSDIKGQRNLDQVLDECFETDIHRCVGSPNCKFSNIEG